MRGILLDGDLVPDVIAEELGHIDRRGCFVRLVFAAQYADHENNPGVRKVVARIILPADKIASIARQLTHGTSADQVPDGPIGVVTLQ